MDDNRTLNNGEISALKPEFRDRMQSADPASVAVLMTCHNRRQLTIACLASLQEQSQFDAKNLFLVDDGSHDGTGAAVLAAFPAAHIIDGDGLLFWNGGMRLAWDRAMASGRLFDFYLWLNDDVKLHPGVLDLLVAEADAAVPRGEEVIMVAATQEPGSATITYGGQRRPDPVRHPLRMHLVEPCGEPLAVDTISGNIVLVSAAATNRLGNLSPAFEHIFGDLDYGLRAVEAGVPVLLASYVGGSCAANSVRGGSLDPDLSRWQRLRLQWSETSRVHARDWRRFVALHDRGGWVGRLMHRLSPYLRIFLDQPHRSSPSAATGGQQYKVEEI